MGNGGEKCVLSDFSAVVPGTTMSGCRCYRFYLLVVFSYLFVSAKKTRLCLNMRRIADVQGTEFDSVKKLFILRKAPSYAAGHCWGLKSVMTETYVVLEHKASCGTLPISLSPVFMYSTLCTAWYKWYKFSAKPWNRDAHDGCKGQVEPLARCLQVGGGREDILHPGPKWQQEQKHPGQGLPQGIQVDHHYILHGIRPQGVVHVM